MIFAPTLSKGKLSLQLHPLFKSSNSGRNLTQQMIKLCQFWLDISVAIFQMKGQQMRSRWHSKVCSSFFFSFLLFLLFLFFFLFALWFILYLTPIIVNIYRKLLSMENNFQSLSYFGGHHCLESGRIRGDSKSSEPGDRGIGIGNCCWRWFGRRLTPKYRIKFADETKRTGPQCQPCQLPFGMIFSVFVFDVILLRSWAEMKVIPPQKLFFQLFLFLYSQTVLIALIDLAFK